ncbi:hypothetical protein [Paenibacillus thermotolerans]|uniref:hypothetical protein n=1 Tax=Paenibacillus thermotolerans TaxID=3027807 RepID=UPI002368EF24|nr:MULTISPECIES: hypothetical protein [unclassified Paenibacillus]
MNGFLISAVCIALLLIGVLLYWRKKGGWSTVYESMELSEEASNQFAYLQDNGIRCRMRNQALHTGHSDTLNVRVILEVHKDDLMKAKSLLENRGNGKYEFNFMIQ